MLVSKHTVAAHITAQQATHENQPRSTGTTPTPPMNRNRTPTTAVTTQQQTQMTDTLQGMPFPTAGTTTAFDIPPSTTATRTEVLHNEILQPPLPAATPMQGMQICIAAVPQAVCHTQRCAAAQMDRYTIRMPALIEGDAMPMPPA